jgi:hypothetical protein
MRVLSHTLAGVVAAVFITACGGGITPAPGGASGAAAARQLPAASAGKLITINLLTTDLEYWPIESNGGTSPQKLSGPLGISSPYGMAANGNLIIMASYDPAEVVTYDVKTKAETSMADPFGGAVDVAVDRQGTIYALNTSGVTVFKGSSAPTQLSCPQMTTDEAIAVDDEGDVFINGYGRNVMGVAEVTAGSTNCKVLTRLRRERGYIGGIGIDPNTDDLIVVDDPDLCAGGIEGRMLIYVKPYRRDAVRWRNLNADYCAGTFRLDAASKHIFVSDATISAGFPLIDQRTYPRALGSGIYQDRGSSGYFGGFTTIPNSLPN